MINYPVCHVLTSETVSPSIKEDDCAAPVGLPELYCSLEAVPSAV
jgi:hypothetical protein